MIWRVKMTATGAAEAVVVVVVTFVYNNQVSDHHQNHPCLSWERMVNVLPTRRGIVIQPNFFPFSNNKEDDNNQISVYYVVVVVVVVVEGYIAIDSYSRFSSCTFFSPRYYSYLEA